MSKYKSEIIAVKYYLEKDTNYTKTCEILGILKEVWKDGFKDINS